MIELLQSYGLVGLFVGSFLAATVVPFSSEVILTGVLIADVNPVYAFFCATFGNWLGGMTSYYFGRLVKWDLLEKWFRVKEETLIKQKARVAKYGSLLAFVTWMPILGDVISIALGFYRIDFVKSSIFMLLGRALRFATWIFLFHILGEQLFEVSIF